ncbi:hypothetical protein [Estrella lausannensis]|uniref:Conserved putative membrane protein n=1 Tax=Estrella lausannensis TaxID=483423 RepID=A0A0H5DRL2_9BACT|nr:hypothetical protein [Estrella lausannensis]CRX39341.1 Conserved putative membrane protein [Estrella lausannensis]
MKVKVKPFDSPTAAFEELENFKAHEQKQLSHDLQLFKQLLEANRTSFSHHPYTLKKGIVVLYKTIFFILGILISFLGIYICSTSYNFIADHLIAATLGTKIFIAGLSATLATLAFFFAAKMQPHREIALGFAKNAKHRAKRLYMRKVFYLRYQRAIEHAEIDDAKTSWKFLLEDVIETIEDRQEDTLLLLERIYQSATLRAEEKEKLFNQALYEFHTSLKKALQFFESGISPRI